MIRLLSRNQSGTTIAELAPRDIGGAECIGFSELYLNYNINVHQQKDGAILSLQHFRARVKLVGLPGGEKLIGEAQPDIQNPIRSSPHNTFSSTFTLKLPLSLEQLNRIEEIRNVEGLNLSVELGVQVTGNDHDEYITEKGPFQIHQSQWINFLKKTRYANLLLFEIPIPIGENSTNLSKAIKQLSSAKKHFVQGEYRQTIALCRESLESARKILGFQKDIAEANNLFTNGKQRDMDKHQRELFMKYATHHYAHLAHHAGNDGDFTSFNRREASMVLGITSCLLSVAGTENHNVSL